MKRLVIIALLGAVSAAATGCNISPSAATVNGAVITQARFDADLATLSSSRTAQCALELQGASLPALKGSGASTVTSGFAAGELSTLIEQELVGQALARRHLTVSSSGLAAAKRDVAAELMPPPGGSPSPCGMEGAQLLAALPPSFAHQQVLFQAQVESLLASVARIDISPAAIRHYYDSHRSLFEQDCLSDIVVATQAEAAKIRAKVEAGGSFASEAKAHSLDQQTASGGGALGCLPTSQITNPSLVSALAALSIGQVSQPLFEAQVGPSGSWVLLQVTGRPVSPLSHVSGQIRRQLLGAHGNILQAKLTSLVHSAKVTVDPRYGHWKAAGGVVPPVPPPARDLISPPQGTPTAGG
ncbi:MAG: peptidyl-prolyl cis-trans isomerase [Acidimicrobiales bacterium]